MSQNVKSFEYKIKAGDTLSGIIFKMYGYGMNDSRYSDKESYILSINSHITNPDLIRTGDILQLNTLPSITKNPVPKSPSRINQDEFQKDNTIIDEEYRWTSLKLI